MAARGPMWAGTALTLAAVVALAPAARADAVPNAISGIVTAKAQAMGGTADQITQTQASVKSRMQEMVSGIVSGVAGAAASVGIGTAIAGAVIGTVTIPAWGTFVLAAAGGAAVGVAVNWTIDGVWGYFVDSNGKGQAAVVDPATGKLVPAPKTNPLTNGTALTAGGGAFGVTGSNPFTGASITCTGTSPEAVKACVTAASYAGSYQGNGSGGGGGYAPGGSNQLVWRDTDTGGFAVGSIPRTCTTWTVGGGGECAFSQLGLYGNPGNTTASKACDTPVMTNGSCGSYTGAFIGPAWPGQGGGPMTAQQAIAQMPASDQGKPANPELLAAAANDMWRRASAQPGYGGVPFSPSNAITPQDVAQWRVMNPDSYPKGSDLQQMVTNNTVNVTNNTTNTWNNTATNSNGTTLGKIDFGPDPGITLPEPAEVPLDGLSIKDAFPSVDSNLVPTINGWKWPEGVNAVPCPKMEFNPGLYVNNGPKWDQTFIWDQHCPVVERIRPDVQKIMSAFYTILMILLILSA